MFDYLLEDHLSIGGNVHLAIKYNSHFHHSSSILIRRLWSIKRTPHVDISGAKRAMKKICRSWIVWSTNTEDSVDISVTPKPHSTQRKQSLICHRAGWFDKRSACWSWCYSYSYSATAQYASGAFSFDLATSTVNTPQFEETIHHLHQLGLTRDGYLWLMFVNRFELRLCAINGGLWRLLKCLKIMLVSYLRNRDFSNNWWLW